MSVLLYRYLILMKVHKVIPILSTFNLVVCVCLCVFSCVRLYTLWTIACQAPLSMEFSRQEYWIGLPFPPPGYLPVSGTEPVSPVSPAFQEDSLPPEQFRKLSELSYGISKN